MPSRSTAIAVALVAAVAALLALTGPAAAPAQADVYCAPSPCGEGTPVATLQEAVEDADNHIGPDDVAIPAGTYETVEGPCGGLYVDSDDTHVRGAGIGQTILTAKPPPAEFGGTRRIICGHMHLSDVTLRLPSDVTPGHNSSVEGIDLYSGLVERVKIDAVGATFAPGSNDGEGHAGLLREGAAREIEVDIDPSLDAYGLQAGYLDELRDVSVRVRGQALGIRVAQEPGDPPMRVSHVVLRGNQPLSVANETGLDAKLELSDAVLDSSATPPGVYETGLMVYNGLPPHTIALAMDRVTIVGNGAAESQGIRIEGEGGPGPTLLEARHVIVSGFEKTLFFGFYGSGIEAKIDYSNLDLSPSAIGQEGEGPLAAVFGPGNRSGNPLFLAPATGDYRLAAGSPAIDIGGPDLIAGGATDLGGAPRPTDGNGDGTVLADAGAFEHGTEVISPADKNVEVEILGKRLRLDRHGAVKLKLRCPASEQSPPCQGRVALRTKAKVEFGGKRRKVVLAKGKFKLAAGRTVTVKLKLAPAKAELVRDDPAARRVLASARVRDAAGNSAKVSRTLKLAVAAG